MNAWLAATRPKTLPASAVPVLIALAYAYRNSGAEPPYSTPVALLTLFCAVGLQILANFTNELGDYKRGADTPDRTGPQRAVSSGIISPQAMKRSSLLLAAVVFCAGMLIVAHAGWVIFAIGCASLFFAYAYTSGPYPLAYRGLGDVFALLFFGIIPVCGAYYAQMQEFRADVLISSLIPGFFAANILGVNNIRDRETDARVGKMTLAVRLGRPRAETLFGILLCCSYVVAAGLAATSQSWFMLLPLLTLPLALRLWNSLRRSSGAELNAVLAGTGKLLVVFGVLLCIGILFR
ncbi:MAG: 1,4-dihydroxy-2-naphthoate polyprenyltransferase [Candidatus Kapabacteria bacterium]|nr:1,4-dihydroxy-2-naphthoate polyprenyltransferase [Candidatus Kapabacteria bacterium]